MDDPSWAWPAWKFGMKGDDLFTTLHDKYNTLSVSLRDPEAFHHDVYELSNQAATAEEFHSLMADRQQQRAREINESFESLAVEIIANPSLIGTEQWQHALQLFRTKSYDSIVRYYASYLPSDYSNNGVPGVSFSSTSTPCSGVDVSCTTTKPEIAKDTPCYLDDDDYYPHGPVMAVKPDSHHIQGPLSPPHSEATPSETSDSMSYSSTRPPSPSMSYEGSESERFVLGHLERDDETTSQSDDGETAVSSVCDSVESVSSLDSSEHSVHDKLTPQTVYSEDDYDDDLPTTQFPEDFFDVYDSSSSEPFNDTLESDTPTPRQISGMTSYMDDKTVSTDAKCFAAAIKRSPSPKSQLRLRALGVTSTKTYRRSPEEANSKIQKVRRDTPADPSRRQTAKGQRVYGNGLLA